MSFSLELETPLHVQKAVYEIINHMILKSKKNEVVYIKIIITTKGGEELEDKLLFHIIIHSSQVYDLEQLSHTECGFPELCALLQKMQATEDESHLCIQIPDVNDNTKLQQKSFRAQVSDKGTNKYNLQCVGNQVKSRKDGSKTNLHLRVCEKKMEMMTSSKKIYEYLRLISYVNSKIDISLSLKIQENICEFSFNPSMLFMPLLECSICNNANYILRGSEFEAISPVLEGHTGEVIEVQNVKINHSSRVDMKVWCAASLIKCRWKPHLTSLLTISTYGPRGIPLNCDKASLLPVANALPWSNFSLENSDLIQQNKVKSLTADLVLGLEDLTGQKRYHFVLMLYLFIDEDSKKEDSADIIVRWLKSDTGNVIRTCSDSLANAIHSTVSRALAFRVKTFDGKTCRSYSKAIPVIAKSISSVLLRTSNEDFRKKCLQLLLVESAATVETALSSKLWHIATSCCAVTSVHGSQSHNNIQSVGYVNPGNIPPKISTSDLIPVVESFPNNDHASCQDEKEDLSLSKKSTHFNEMFLRENQSDGIHAPFDKTCSVLDENEVPEKTYLFEHDYFQDPENNDESSLQSISGFCLSDFHTKDINSVAMQHVKLHFDETSHSDNVSVKHENVEQQSDFDDFDDFTLNETSETNSGYGFTSQEFTIKSAPVKSVENNQDSEEWFDNV